MNGGSSVGNGSKPPSRTMSRASSKEALAGAPGLESPSILRKIINGSGAGGTGSRPTTPLGGGGMGQNGLRTTYSAVESVNPTTCCAQEARAFRTAPAALNIC